MMTRTFCPVSTRSKWYLSNIKLQCNEEMVDIITLDRNLKKQLRCMNKLPEMKKCLDAIKDVYKKSKVPTGIACGIKNTGIGNGMPDDGIVVIDSLDELFEMVQLNVSNSVAVLREDIQQLSLPASLAPDGQCVSCAEVGESYVTSYSRLSPTAYKVSVRTDKPFLLVVSESYDPLWMAVVNDDREYTSIPLSGIVNGYWIEETGELEIRVEYRAQRALAKGTALSLLTATLLGIYWIVQAARNRSG